MAARWTEEEKRIVQIHYGTKSAKEIHEKYLPNRNPTQIRAMGRKIGVKKDIRATRGWTEEKVELVKKYYPILKTSEIQRLYLSEFTEKQIAEFATKCLGLEKEDEYFIGWSKQEIDYLKQNYEFSKMTVSEFAEILNKDERQVSYVAKSLNLKKDPKTKVEIMLKSTKRTGFNTKPQLIVNDILDKNEITYEREFVCEYYAIDNYLTDYNLMIEVQGDYWHRSPFLSENKQKCSYGKRDVGHDKAKHSYLRNSYGIEILYLWESDINNNDDLCEKLILEYIKNDGVLKNYHSFNYTIANGKLSLKQEIIPFAY